jgi:hypothetical protein
MVNFVLQGFSFYQITRFSTLVYKVNFEYHLLALLATFSVQHQFDARKEMEDENQASDHPNLAVFYIEGLGILLVGIVGCIINLTAIWRLVFGQRGRKRHTFHYLLTSLSVYDLVSLLFQEFTFRLNIYD